MRPLISYLVTHSSNKPLDVACVDHLPASFATTTSDAIGTGAVSFVETRWFELCRIVLGLVASLEQHGVRSGDRIVNLERNSVYWAGLDLACSALGCIHVPIDHRVPDAARVRMLETVEPSVVFGASPAMFERLSITRSRGISRIQDWTDDDASTGYREIVSAIHELEARSWTSRQSSGAWESPATILFTSGTTGQSRGVTLSHRNLVSNALAKLDAMPERADDLRLNFLPFAHAYARTCELTTWLIVGSQMHTVNNIEHCLRAASSIAPSLINGVPYFYQQLHHQWKENGGSEGALRSILGPRIRRLASGGAALPQNVRADFEEAGLPIYQGYGLTETSPVVCSNRDCTESQNRILENVGPAVRGNELRIDENNRLWVRGDCVMLGYWNDPDATQERIVNGWLNTGDLARWQQNSASGESTICILGRSDDTIVLSTGDKVHPAAIERRLVDLFPFERCMLVGTGKPSLVLLASLKPSDSDMTIGNNQNLIDAVCNALVDLPKFERPQFVLLVDEPWTSENGLLNFKGAVNRKRVEAFYNDRIEQLHRL